MKRYIAPLVALLLGCSTPDGDDIGDLADGIRDLPAADQGIVTGNKRNDRLLDVVRRKDPGSGKHISSKIVGSVTCTEPTPDEFRDWALPFDPPVLAAHIVDWLIGHPGSGLDGLRDHLERTMTPGRASANLPGNPPCTPRLVMRPGWKLEELESEADAMAKDEDEATDSAYWLPTLSSDELKQRPVLMTVLGLAVVAGAVVVILPVTPIGLGLCALSKDVPCPGDPLSPGETPSPSTGTGGDR
jgi:hypothetical protein